MAPGGWEALRRRYLAAIDDAKQIVATSTAPNDRLIPVGDLPEFDRGGRGPSTGDAAVVNASRSRTAGVGSCTWLVAPRRLTLLWAEISRCRNNNVTLFRRGTHAIRHGPGVVLEGGIWNSSSVVFLLGC